MEIGDKIRYKNLDMFTGGLTNLTAGKEYEIIDISKFSIVIPNDTGSYAILDKVNTNKKWTKYIWDFFYKPGELRQIKLKTIL